MPHLFVTNDFPPKIGGIQSMLWELWRRLPSGEATVLTTAHEGDRAFDAAQPFPVVRARSRVLLPRPGLAARIDRLAAARGADLVVLDPALPLGWVGPALRHPYAVVLHGAEVTVPGRLPGTRSALARVLREASLVVAAGGYPAAEAARAAGGADRLPPVAVVPPGVDTTRFRPLHPAERATARARFGLPAAAPLVLGLSRLVPRKGFDVLIEAVGALQGGGRHPDLVVAVAGAGRDRDRLQRVARRAGVPVRFLGRVPDADLSALYGCADVFAMCCRDRWLGLEQEGFGIVFVEAAACGVPSVAGRSGGSHEAVVHGETGLVVDRPADPRAVASALDELLGEPARRAAMGDAARRRAVAELSYDVLAARLAGALAGGWRR